MATCVRSEEQLVTHGRVGQTHKEFLSKHTTFPDLEVGQPCFSQSDVLREQGAVFGGHKRWVHDVHLRSENHKIVTGNPGKILTNSD